MDCDIPSSSSKVSSKNPPAVGDPETVYYRRTLYIAYLATSGFAALGAALLYRKLKEAIKLHKDSRMLIELLPIAIYAVIMIRHQLHLC